MSRKVNFTAYSYFCVSTIKTYDFEKVQKNTKFFHIFEKTDYQKYILTMDDDLDTDFDGIKKINVIDWLLKG